MGRAGEETGVEGQTQADAMGPKTARPGGPDAFLRQHVGYVMKRAYHLLQVDASRALEPFDLRVTTYSALCVIVSNPDLRQSQLAETLSMERSNTVAVVDHLEKLGLVDRCRVPSDRRSYALRATTLGRQVSQSATKAISKGEAALMSGLSADEVETLLRLLNRVERSGRDKEV